MNSWQQTWLHGSIGRAILITLLVVSTVPIILFSVLSNSQNTRTLTEKTQTDLQSIIQAHAATIDLKLKEVFDTTYIAAQQVQSILREQPDGALLAALIARYQPDARGITGLDAYYSQAGNAAPDSSNVFWGSAEPIPADVAEQIVITEKLDTLFASIKAVSPDTQWIYFTSTDGMMRLYPWASNDHYPDNWDPRQILFYTIAEPANNPTLEPRWTPPYVDYAGAGRMITLSIPIVDAQGTFLGVMSQDITISALKDVALNINVLNGSGAGFLIDGQGEVIAHRDIEPADASKGSQTNTNLLETGSSSFRAVAQPMLAGSRGFGYFTNEQGEEQLLVYEPVPTIGWRLGIVVPQTEVLALATGMQRQAMLISVLMIIAAVFVSFLLTRIIHRPLLQLLNGVKHLSEDDGSEIPIKVNSFIELNNLAQSFNEMAAKVRARETKLKAQVLDLRIEIDQQQKKDQLEAVLETDYFKRLEMNAERLRNNLRQALHSDQPIGEIH